MADLEWISNHLEVSGADPALQDFIDGAQGPGFVAWNWPASEDRDYWSALLLQGGAPNAAVADRLVKRYADYIWWAIGDAQTAADRGFDFVPLDLNALRPIPAKVLRKGWHAAGSDWCWEAWGTRLPLRRVSFNLEHRRQRKGFGIDTVAVYQFMSADWSPWRSLRTWHRKWPRLKFDLRPVYDIEPESEIQKAA